MERFARICTTGSRSCRFCCRRSGIAGDDANLLARTLLQQFATEVGKNGISFGAEALRAIRAYEWPGNVRELQNRVKRAVIMSSNRRVTAQDLELSSAGSCKPASFAKRGAGSFGAGHGEGSAAQARWKDHRGGRGTGGEPADVL
jgi:DNA-binding NtrC family response regulator